MNESEYQALKARLIADLLVDVHGASHYGLLVARSADPTQTQGAGSIHDPVTELQRSFGKSPSGDRS